MVGYNCFCDAWIYVFMILYYFIYFLIQYLVSSLLLTGWVLMNLLVLLV